MPKRNSALVSDDNGPPSSTNSTSEISANKRIKTAKDLISDAKNKDENGDNYWELNDKGTRRVTVSDFKGRTMVNIREYYEKDGKMLPGKKGISLLLDQFSALVEVLPQLDNLLRSKGQRIPRPAYDTGASENATDQSLDDTNVRAESAAQKLNTKANYEDTSDEDSASG